MQPAIENIPNCRSVIQRLRLLMKRVGQPGVWVRLSIFASFAVIFALTSSAALQRSQFILAGYVNFDRWDLGVNWLFHTWLRVVLWRNPMHTVAGGDLFAFETTVVFLFALLILLPRLPLLATIGGEIVLLIVWWTFGELSATTRAFEAWNVALGSVFIASLPYWRGTKRDYLSAAFFGAFLGFFPLMRQSAVQTFTACLLITVVLLLAAGVTRYLKRDKRFFSTQAGLEWSFLNYLKPLATFTPFFLAIKYGALWLWCHQFDRPWVPHGIGGSMLASLGFADNAYNMVYDDDFLTAQGLLIGKVFWKTQELSETQAKLGEIWKARVLEDPAHFLHCLEVKVRYLIHYFTGTLNVQATAVDAYPLSPSWITLVMGSAFCGTIVFGMVLFTRHRCDRWLLIMAGFFALMAASMASLVIVCPFYTGGAIAFFCASGLVFAPAMVWIPKENASPATAAMVKRNTRVCVIVGALMLAGSLAVGGFSVYQGMVNRRVARELLNGDPMQSFQRLEYRFSWEFNRLSPAEKQTVLRRLLAPEHKGQVFRPLKSAASASPFEPLLVLSGNECVCVVARLSSKWKMLLPSRIQGPRNSLLFVVKNVDHVPGVNHYLDSPFNYLKICDTSWDDGIHMFCLPSGAPFQPGDVNRNASFFGVGACNFKYVDHNLGLVLDTISATRLYRDVRIEASKN